MDENTTVQPDRDNGLKSKNMAVALVLLGLAGLMFIITMIRIAGA